MKRTILTLALVLGSSLCSQSFGFDLLDRMLGHKGCGAQTSCCDTGCDLTSCEPACGCEAPACGGCASDSACGCGEPACGCEAPLFGLRDSACGCGQPACGFETAGPCGCDDPCGKKRCGGLLAKLFNGHRGHGCDSGCDLGCGCAEPVACGCAEPACGCEAPLLGGFGHGCDSGCDSACGCGHKHGGLLKKLFGNLKRHHGCDSGCDSGCDVGCGCGAAPVMANPTMEVAPMPPAPVVDPSASVNSKRRVIQASVNYVR